MQRTKTGEPLGWIIEHANGRIGWSSYATAIPNEGETAPFEIGGANAALIVKATNNYEALVKALEYARVGIVELCHEQNPANECWNILREIDAALAGAK